MMLGCDPEIFLVDAAGAFVSAIGKIGGSKQAPRRLPLGEGYAVQEDNVALEFNIPPAQTSNEFVDHIKRVKDFLSQEVNEMGLKFSQASATQFPIHELFHPAAMEFGCDPDYNAWTGKVNPRPKATDETLRSCGGHVHIGYKFNNKAEAINLIKYVDLMAGVPSVLMDNGQLRKNLYGKEGAYRFKPYGVEYRTLSNFWIFSDDLIKWVWRAVQRSIDEYEMKRIDINKWGSHIHQAISGNDKDMARSMVDHFGLELA